jgi:hypothetical protein
MEQETHSGQRKYSTFTYDLEGFLTLLKYCLFNTHLTFGGEIYKQFQGITMGANSSTFIANMFLEAYELKFWEQLAQAVTDHPPTMTAEEFKMLPAILPNRRPSTKGDEAIFIAKCFEYLKRYLDDILSMNNPLFTSHEGGPNTARLPWDIPKRTGHRGIQIGDKHTIPGHFDQMQPTQQSQSGDAALLQIRWQRICQTASTIISSPTLQYCHRTKTGSDQGPTDVTLSTCQRAAQLCAAGRHLSHHL